MGDDVSNDVGVPFNPEVEAPVPVDTGLPKTARLVVLLGMQRRMVQIGAGSWSVCKRPFGLNRAGERVSGQCLGCTVSSSAAFDFAGRPNLPYFGFHRSAHFLDRLKGTMQTAPANILQPFREPSINETPLGGSVFLIRRCGNLGGENDASPAGPRFQHTAARQTDLAPQLKRNGHLAPRLDLECGRHTQYLKSVPRKHAAETPAP